MAHTSEHCRTAREPRLALVSAHRAGTQHPECIACSHLRPSANWLPLLCRFYLQGKWVMANWAMAFTASALALCALLHHSMCGPDAELSRVIAIIAMAVAAWANVVCAGHFLRDCFTRKVFTPEKSPNPLMFMKLTHEGIRCVVSHHAQLVLFCYPAHVL